MKNNVKIILSVLFFLLCFRIGIFIAEHKNLENDEIHSQVHSIDRFSYTQMFLGQIGGEGNNAPLFYAIQKGVSDLAGFHAPQSWIDGQRRSADPYAATLLRLQPIFFMSLTIVLIFIYFSFYHSILAGFYSLIMLFSTGYVWVYWAEARHYTLWIFLIAIQSILFILILQKDKKDKMYGHLWRALAITNIALALTVILSMGHTAVSCILLWVFKERDLKKYVLTLIVPCFLCVYYYSRVPGFEYWIPAGFMELIYNNVPKEQLMIIGISAIWLLILFFRQNQVQKLKNFGAILSLFILTFMTAAVLFLGFKLGDTQGTVGNRISSRYFLYLAPLGTIVSVFFSIHIIKHFGNNKWMQLNIGIALIGFLTIIYLKNYPLWVYFQFLKSYLTA